MVNNLSNQTQLFPQMEAQSTASNGNQLIAKLSSYLKTRGGLWRLLACFPGDMPVDQAIAQSPRVFTKARKEVAL